LIDCEHGALCFWDEHAAHRFWVLCAEATNARVAWFSIGSLVVCIVLAAWQLWYLKVRMTRLQFALVTNTFLHGRPL